jgi:DNA-binding transcriptional LysR family regulator
MINIDYRYLKAFLLTAKYLNFSKAAQELNIAQSAVSRQIKLLEESFGEQLIIRSSKKVILTEKGKALNLSIQRFEEMTMEIVKSGSAGHIKVGILHGLLETWFINVARDFLTKTPHQLTITVDSPSNLKNALIDGKIDIIFTTENIQSDLVTSLRLFEEKLVIISKKEIDPKKLENYPWVVYGEGDFLFEQSRNYSKQIITIKSITAMIRLVTEGVGIAIVPDHTLNDKDKVHRYEVKGLKRPQIHLSTLNFETMPKHLDDLIHLIKTLA